MSDYYVKILCAKGWGDVVPAIIPIEAFSIFDAMDKAEKLYKMFNCPEGYEKIGYTIINSEGNEY